MTYLQSIRVAHKAHTSCKHHNAAGCCTLLYVVFLYFAHVSICFADCFDQAAAYQKVNPRILRAISWQETRGRPHAIHYNDNGTIDYGQMQINSIHLPTLAQYGVTRRHLMDSCASIYIGAWYLRRMMDLYGNTWTAVGAYHSQVPAYRDSYARAIKHIIESDKNFSAYERGGRRRSAHALVQCISQN